ncbi:MAG: hypothetical protein RLZZ106_707, partial [Cyanobacteriota bacterium]
MPAAPAQQANALHDGLTDPVVMTAHRGWQQPAATALASTAALLAAVVLPDASRGAPYVPFPSQESLRQVQLAALACARENTSDSCNQVH